MESTYALVDKKNEMEIYLWDNIKEVFEKKIEIAYYNKRGLQPRDEFFEKKNNYTMEDYMMNKKKVKIFFTDYES